MLSSETFLALKARRMSSSRRFTPSERLALSAGSTAGPVACAASSAFSSRAAAGSLPAMSFICAAHFPMLAISSASFGGGKIAGGDSDGPSRVLTSARMASFASWSSGTKLEMVRV